MTSLATNGRRGLAALLCLSLAVWSVTPVPPHTPKILEAIQGHVEMIAGHGHSHGFEEDFFWAIHGHGHDAADHDHGQAFPALEGPTASPAINREARRTGAPPGVPGLSFRIKRPPRA